MKTAARLQQVPDYPFARWGSIVEEVRQTTGREIIRLDIGSPDLPPSPAVIAALNDAARQDHVHGYSSYRGLPALREAFAAYYAQRFGVELDPQTQVTPLIGSKEGIVNLALALLDPGDLVLVPNPGYAPYTAGALLAGAETYPLPLLAENAFLPELDALPSAVVERAKLLWLNYPNNPTGATADLAFFEKALAFARRHNILVCHDAPYCDNSILTTLIIKIPPEDKL